MKNLITKEKLAAFESWMKGRDLSQGTIEKYLRDMGRCAAWLGDKGLSQENLVGYKSFLIQVGYQPVTINSMLSAINTYCYFSGIPERLNFLRIQRKLFRNEEKDLSEKEFNRLLSAAQKQGDIRLQLIMETICSTGIRISELQYITVEAICLGMTQIRLKGKVREILIPGKLCKKLRKYVKKEKIASGEVFIAKSGKGISRKQVWAEMKALAGVAGVDPKKIFPHNLRHLFAKVFYRVTKNLIKLSNILGHSSIETTRIYLQTSLKEHLTDLEKTGIILLQ